MEEGEVPDFTKRPKIQDVVHYKNGRKNFKFIVGTNEYNPYDFKNEIVDFYSFYFQNNKYFITTYKLICFFYNNIVLHYKTLISLKEFFYAKYC